MPGWFDIKGLGEDDPEDKAGFAEAKTRIDAVSICCLTKKMGMLICLILINLPTIPPSQIIEGELGKGIPAEKIVLGGFSQGGAVTVHTALRSNVKLGGK